MNLVTRGGRTARLSDKGFTIKVNPRAIGGKATLCHECRMTSFHPKDVDHRYCGNCNKFHKFHKFHK